MGNVLDGGEASRPGLRAEGLACPLVPEAQFSLKTKEPAAEKNMAGAPPRHASARHRHRTGNVPGPRWGSFPSKDGCGALAKRQHRETPGSELKVLE